MQAFNRAAILAAYYGRQGWQQPTEADYAIVNTANLGATSGVTFDTYHALCNARNLKDVCDDPSITDENFNILLANVQNNAIIEALSSVCSVSSVVDAPSLVYDIDEQVVKSTIPNTGQFVFNRIKVAEGNFAVQIKAVNLFFDGAATFTLYLYNSLKTAAIWSQSVTVSDDIVTVDLSDKELLRALSSTQKGGVFYLGYYQDDLGETMAYDLNGCFNHAKVFGICGGEATASNGNFDRSTPNISTRMYGMVPEIASFRDYTSELVSNAHLFDRLIGLHVAAKVLEMIVHSVRINGTESRIRDNASLQKLYEDLNMGDQTDTMPRTPGVKNQIKAELKAARENFFYQPRAMVVSG